jgi:hypothetical protein
MSPSAWRKLHAYLTVAWALMVPLAILTGWIYSIAFISAISLYANVAGHWSSWQASRAEESNE